MPFETTTQVRFAHIDAAGIVFYPRYFEMLNAAVEDWCAQALGQDFRTLHLHHRIGVPTVKLDVEFVSPSELGDVLTISISPREVGRSSCHLHVVFSGDDRVRLQANVVLVCMDLQTRRATPWPQDMRSSILEGIVHAV
ncbi:MULTISPECIES: acyl-CoA thioesterase [Nitrospirillum]|uniref:Thioesterase n=1 Tax=Nitrospirillum viridazoti CBAmc TaxID=1441467 RepID=A0A248JV05_9PROT|nr:MULTISPECIES: thioesterase family protein [Nitrospirillum]ASG22311.1 thioesterase [Nitrospirillum amazonense CBAmc]MEA1674596.1 thioesterase family protein [Nitrospirillum sp. BR 11163]TWB43162.1 4-hydroxybenzoyl-CoA thioesterase [Nitrospirillum amazonense]